jgi:hypothetical protein
LLADAGKECQSLVAVPIARARSLLANAITVRPLPQTAGSFRWRVVAGVPGPFLGGYASVKAAVQPSRAGLVALIPALAWAWS